MVVVAPSRRQPQSSSSNAQQVRTSRHSTTMADTCEAPLPPVGRDISPRRYAVAANSLTFADFPCGKPRRTTRRNELAAAIWLDSQAAGRRVRRIHRLRHVPAPAINFVARLAWKNMQRMPLTQARDESEASSRRAASSFVSRLAAKLGRGSCRRPASQRRLRKRDQRVGSGRRKSSSRDSGRPFNRSWARAFSRVCASCAADSRDELIAVAAAESSGAEVESSTRCSRRVAGLISRRGSGQVVLVPEVCGGNALGARKTRKRHRCDCDRGRPWPWASYEQEKYDHLARRRSRKTGSPSSPSSSALQILDGRADRYQAKPEAHGGRPGRTRPAHGVALGSEALAR